MRRSVLLLPVLAATLVTVLAGCSDETPGNATPGDSGPKTELPTLPGGTEPTDPGEDTSSSEPSSDGPLADVEPCDLVPDQTKAQLNLADESSSEEGPARVCRWHYEEASTGDRYSMDVSIFDDLGIEDISGADDNIEPVPKVGSHEAVTWTWQSATCNVTVATSKSSRVDFGVTDTTQKACQLTMQLAQAVEPELP